MDKRVIDINSEMVSYLASKDKYLYEAIQLIGSIPYGLHTNDESFFVETIIGQMLSNKVADTITERLYRLCKGKATAEKIVSLGFEKVKSIGISAQKAEYILFFSDLILENPEFLAHLSSEDDDAVLHKLTAIRGIGNWTAKMYLIFVLDRPDVLPFEDGAFLQSYKWLYQTKDVSPKSIKEKCSCWHPYASIGARYLYRLLDYGVTKHSSLEVAKRDWVMPEF